MSTNPKEGPPALGLAGLIASGIKSLSPILSQMSETQAALQQIGVLKPDQTVFGALTGGGRATDVVRNLRPPNPARQTNRTVSEVPGQTRDIRASDEQPRQPRRKSEPRSGDHKRQQQNPNHKGMGKDRTWQKDQRESVGPFPKRKKQPSPRKKKTSKRGGRRKRGGK